MPAKGRIAAGVLLVVAAATAFALPRLLVRAQPRTQAEQPPAEFSVGPGPVKVVRVAPSLVTSTVSPSVLSPAKHAQQRVVLTIRRGPSGTSARVRHPQRPVSQPVSQPASHAV